MPETKERKTTSISIPAEAKDRLLDYMQSLEDAGLSAGNQSDHVSAALKMYLQAKEPLVAKMKKLCQG